MINKSFFNHKKYLLNVIGSENLMSFFWFGVRKKKVEINEQFLVTVDNSVDRAVRCE